MDDLFSLMTKAMQALFFISRLFLILGYHVESCICHIGIGWSGVSVRNYTFPPIQWRTQMRTRK